MRTTRRPDEATAPGPAPVPAAPVPAGAANGADLGPGLEEDLPLLSPRVVTAAVAAALSLVLALVMLLLPPPYVVQSPGPTADTIGELGDEPLITVEGAETYPTEGELLLTTVSTRGGPGFPASAGQVLKGWLSSATTVVPRETAFEPGQTREEVSEQSTLQMSSSQNNAAVSALTALGHDVQMELLVAGTSAGGASEGILEAEDVLESITVDGERTELTSFAVLSEVLAQTPPGTTVEIGISREGEETDVEVTTSDDGEDGSLLGVLISPEVDLPVDVSFAIENIGGPSAGLMLSLGIIDLLTPGSLTGGAVVAGTGTIDLAGEVGPIGGITQKLAGAHRDGAEWFLAPVDNCAEAVGATPSGLEVVAVETLEDAVAALEDIAAGSAEDLPRCPAP